MSRGEKARRNFRQLERVVSQRHEIDDCDLEDTTRRV
jgi:ribosomal protein L37AE/L43A